MGRVSKGVVCSVEGCNEPAVRSVSRRKIEESGVGFKLKESKAKRIYLCRKHYKEFKKAYRKNVWKTERFARGF